MTGKNLDDASPEEWDKAYQNWKNKTSKYVIQEVGTIEEKAWGSLNTPQDKIVESVVEKYRQRSEVGKKKYGTTLERNDLSFDQWLNHISEELMDAVLYIERVRNENRKVGE